jgi:hypothetical protein
MAKENLNAELKKTFSADKQRINCIFWQFDVLSVHIELKL